VINMKIEDVQSMGKEIAYRHKFVNKRLKNLWEDDEEFRDYFEGIFEFYKNKLYKVLGNRVNHDDFLESYFVYIADLFYQGYYLGRELLENKEATFADRFFEQPNGVIKEQTYDILNGAAGDLIQLLSHEESAEFETSIIQENEAARPVLLQIKTDIATLGTYQAFLDERNTRKLSVYPESDDEFKGLLHRADDLFFVDPQKYFICLYTDGHSEVWELNLWQTVPTRNRKIGEVHVSVYEPEVTNRMIEKLPFYQGYEGLKKSQKSITMTLTLTERVDEKEQLPIVANMVESIKSRLNVEYDDINVSLSVTEKLYNYKYNPIPVQQEEEE
jgi:hypothetical protein